MTLMSHWPPLSLRGIHNSIPKNADLKRYCGLNRARYRGYGVYQTLAKIVALAPPKSELRPNTG
ncbi:hypothetical protein HZB07_06815 [Candidatus Saganbacteria bacterium]|nr:hypothetical protein [Candidatus Saganbacteria bacterium]